MAYPATLWAQVQNDYSTGDYSLPELSQKYSIPEVTLKNHCQKDKWVKGGLKVKIQRDTQQIFIEAFAKKGFDAHKVAEVVDAMVAADRTVIVPSGQEGQSGFAEQVPDWQARDKAITQYAKLTGSYAVEKHEFEYKNNILKIAQIVGELINQFVPVEKREQARAFMADGMQ